MTEAVPIPATALLPLVIFPVFDSGVAVNDVGASYGNNIIFLFMGGFLLAMAMQRWNLHRRIALLTVNATGTKPTMVIAGFMIATGFLSMWVSNTATAVMMIPIGVSVLVLVLDIGKKAGAIDDSDGSGSGENVAPDEKTITEAVIESNFGTALMLGIAYAASIGSLGTIIATPPNTLLVGYLEGQGVTIGFLQWMVAGVPLAVVLLVITWFLLTHVMFKPESDDIPGGKQLIRGELDSLGAMSQGEIRVAIIFLAAAASWVDVPLLFDSPPISDTGIAMTAALLLFLLPSGSKKVVRLIDWETAVKLPWGVLLLFGGGLALSAQFESSGLTEWIGSVAGGLDTIPVVLLVMVATAAIIFLTEIASNTATAATFLPVAGGVAMGMDIDILVLTVPVALAATCAFMLPVATPPNAVSYASGYITIGQMMRGGFWLNLIAIALITVAAYTVFAWSLGIQF
ncbi:SLC13 family permease [Rhodococcoides fascians]|uniref:SLC13 family permease n=1 Tax=Rhodococcoides fascians TaxID=1828 RepID=UPI000A9D4EAA|nr:DASS family sodium-coupled anion symporter [Rhodococcus fascians]